MQKKITSWKKQIKNIDKTFQNLSILLNQKSKKINTRNKNYRNGKRGQNPKLKQIRKKRKKVDIKKR